MVNEWKLLHYDTLNEFQQQYYEGVLRDTHIDGPEVNFSKLKFPDEGEEGNFWGWELTHEDQRYLLPSRGKNFEEVNIKDLVPFVPLHTQKVAFNKNVYQLINKYKKINIAPENRISFKECVHRLSPFNHTHGEQYTLFTIVALAQYFGRCNIRISTKPGFGKDSTYIILRNLFGKAYNIVKPTTAKLELLAQNGTLVSIHEVVDVPGAEWRNIEQFLLAAGAFNNEVTKSSRSFEGVGEVIDIHDLSIALCYNDIDQYPEGEYLDAITKGAVLDRFLPLRFAGTLQHDFTQIATEDVASLASNNQEWFVDLIKSLLYWGQRDIKNSIYKGKNFSLETDKPMSNRHKQNYFEVMKFVAMYAEDEEEYNHLKRQLDTSIDEYQYMIQYGDVLKSGELTFEETKTLKKMPTFTERVKKIKSGNIQQPTGGINDYV